MILKNIKFKKIILVIILNFFLFAPVIDGYAITLPYGTKQSSYGPFTPMISTSYRGKTAEIYAILNASAESVYKVMKLPDGYRQLSLNGRLAFCVDADKYYGSSYVYNQTVTEISNGRWRQIYQYAVNADKETKEIIQIMIWMMIQDEGLSAFSSMDKEKFDNYMMVAMANYNENSLFSNVNSFMNYCVNIKGDAASSCAYNLSQRKGMYGPWVACKTYARSYERFTCFDSLISSNGQQSSSSGGGVIGGADIFAKNGVFTKQKNKTENLWNAILDTDPYPNSLYIWSAINSQGKIQRIIAPPAEDLTPSCNNVLGTLMDLYNYSDATKESLKNNPEWVAAINKLAEQFSSKRQYLTSDYANPTCGPGLDCQRMVTEYYYEKVPNNNSKDIQRFNYIRTGIKSQTLIDECPGGDYCDTKLPELLKGYPNVSMRNANNAKYMQDLEDLKNNILDPERLDLSDISNPTCKTGSGGKCEEDLGKILNNPTATVCADIENLKKKYSQITVAYNGNTCVPSTAKCGPAEPYCPPDFGNYECNFFSYQNGFYFSDAILNKQRYDDCWKNYKIAYTAESGQVSSLASVSSDLGEFKYCEIKCWEDFTGDFPTAVSHIESGTMLFWGANPITGEFGSIKANRSCYTDNINYAQFRTDWANNETQVLDAYNRYVAQETYNNNGVINRNTVCHTNDTTGCTATHEEKSCPGGYALKGDTCYNYDLADYRDDGKCNSGSVSSVPGDGNACVIATRPADKRTVCDSCPSGYDVVDNTCKKRGTNYGKSHVNLATNNGDICIANDYTGDKKERFNSHYNLASELTNRKNKVLSEMNDRKKIAGELESCQSTNVVTKDSIYKFITTISLNYSDPTGTRNIANPSEMVLTGEDRTIDTSSSKLSNPGVDSAACTSTPKIPDTSGKCNTGQYGYNLYSEFNWEFSGKFTFSYNSNEFTWKVIKESAFVTKRSETSSETYSYDLGFGIPTSFKTATGFYDISVDIENFGHNGHFNELVNEKLNSNVYNYSCPYHVENKIYAKECHYDCDFNSDPLKCTLLYSSPEYCPDPGGIDIVYRLIEMNTEKTVAASKKIVFPSIDGDGRTPGDNWDKFIISNPTWFLNIVNPRTIYDSKPIYEIDLDPALINQIRADTLEYRNSNNDPYTSFKNQNGQKKIICKGDTPSDQTCASEYITTLINSGEITGYYTECLLCNTTGGRLDYIDVQKERYKE